MKSTERLDLDRMAIEEAGPNPDRIAAAIHEQLALSRAPAPILEIAKALDIVEIREARISSFEAALVTTPERGEGSIVVNVCSSRQRRLYSVAHELGHFLNPWHRPLQGAKAGGFACRTEDLGISWKDRSSTQTRHAQQEAEANRFAIELLAPKKFVRSYLHGIPDLGAVLRMSENLDLSREAAARRYAEQHEQATALVFSKDGKVRYAERRGNLPYVQCTPGQWIPTLPPPTGTDNISDHVEADWRDWLSRSPHCDLVVQTLHQQNGYAITLLALDQSDISHDEDED
jgi:Zn-dependent peptidase ImmA (M78 family)